MTAQGEKVRLLLEECKSLVAVEPIAYSQRILNVIRRRFADRDAAGCGLRPEAPLSRLIEGAAREGE